MGPGVTRILCILDSQQLLTLPFGSAFSPASRSPPCRHPRTPLPAAPPWPSLVFLSFSRNLHGGYETERPGFSAILAASAGMPACLALARPW